MSKALYYLDYVFKFLFINSKGKALLTSAKLIQLDEDFHADGFFMPSVTAENAKSIYDQQIRRYFGLGFLSSFIPGTEAFIARTEYFSSLLKLHKNIRKNASDSDLPLLHYTNLSPFYFLNNYVLRLYGIPWRKDGRDPPKRTFAEALLELPLVSDWQQSKKYNQPEEWYKNLGHTLLNPLRILSSLLRFFHFSLDALIDLIKPYDHLARAGLRILSVVIFYPFHFLAAVAESTVDFVLNCLDTLLIDPLRFGYEVAQQGLQTLFSEYFYVSSEEYDGVAYINLAINGNVNNRFETKVTQSENYTLTLFTDNEKETYIEESQFYKRMKDNLFFSKSDNFLKLSKTEKQTLTLLNDWKKFRQLKLLESDVSLPDDVLSVISIKLMDLAGVEVESGGNTFSTTISL
ncbi:MAG: hypothetical protein H0T84_14615 [Tatlockia sp.]|nr:hypothetical protein [Tatlockia sp.]